MKRMFALLLALCMTMAAAGAMAACECERWAELQLVGDALVSGNYCLDKNSDLPSDSISISIGSGAKVILCLHGKQLNASITNNGDLTLVDCTGEGSVTGDGEYDAGVENYGKFTMHGGSVAGGQNANSVGNYGTFTMHGGSVASGQNGSGVNNQPGSTFTMHGGSVEGGQYGTGVYNWPDSKFTMYGGSVTSIYSDGVNNQQGSTFTMHGGSVTGGSDEYAVAYYIPDGVDEEQGYPIYRSGTEEETTAACLAPGSYKVSGGFCETSVVVAKIPGAGDMPDTGSLPQTGDPSMLGAWVCLLGAAGMKLRRKK